MTGNTERQAYCTFKSTRGTCNSRSPNSTGACLTGPVQASNPGVDSCTAAVSRSRSRPRLAQVLGTYLNAREPAEYL